MTDDASSLHYDSRTILLHWLTAILVVLLWCVGQTIDWFPRGDLRTFARGGHICTGVLLALLIVWRIVWRSTGGRHLPPADTGALQFVAKATHLALYVLLVSTVVLGIANTWIRGDNLFNLFRIPSIAPDDKALRGLVEGWHEWSANILVGVAALHALAGLAHRFVKRDRVLNRMLTG